MICSKQLTAKAMIIESYLPAVFKLLNSCTYVIRKQHVATNYNNEWRATAWPQPQQSLAPRKNIRCIHRVVKISYFSVVHILKYYYIGLIFNHYKIFCYYIILYYYIIIYYYIVFYYYILFYYYIVRCSTGMMFLVCDIFLNILISQQN